MCIFISGGYNSIFAFLNSFVHIWMYLYYGISALGPAFQKYLWWKKYLTMLQMVGIINYNPLCYKFLIPFD